MKDLYSLLTEAVLPATGQYIDDDPPEELEHYLEYERNPPEEPPLAQAA